MLVTKDVGTVHTNTHCICFLFQKGTMEDLSSSFVIMISCNLSHFMSLKLGILRHYDSIKEMVGKGL